MIDIMNCLKKIKRFTIGEIVPFFEMVYYNAICNPYICLFGKRDSRKLKYRVSLCLIFKNESPFLKEWIDYHLSIGVDHFYLYNNGSDDNFMQPLSPYIENEIVTLIEWPEKNSQFKAYKHCYDTFRNSSNWIAFLDADEFICPKYDQDVNQWIKHFDKFHAINIHWLMFCTGGQLTHDYTKNVIEQYHSCWEDLSSHGKCFINTRFDIANFDTWHVHHHTYMFRKIFGINHIIPAVNQFGYICIVDKTWGCGKNKLRNSTIQINHYFTKAWDIWSKKMKSTDVLFANNPKADINYFYNYEEKCNNTNYTISRFFIRMKIKQGLIS